ncbi:MAG: ABC transporter permease, partial [Eubacteriales bacterium]|nr:ABC transporter permease [Eubacteriales bacterium]
MRLWAALKNELRFCYRYGIVFLYLFFTAAYALLLFAVPGDAKRVLGIILIFTDPAAMGLFFMGAVVLLESSQRVHWSLAVSPMTHGEYIIGKAGALLLLGTAVGAAVGVCAGLSLGYVLLAVPLASVLFSLCGLMAATKAQSLNRFLLLSVGFELVICLPAILYLFDVITGGVWLLHPGVAAISLLRQEASLLLPALLSLLLWGALAAILCNKAVERYFLR